MNENVIRKDLGAVSAYALAVSKGYTGTEEEFATEQANFAQNAQQVSLDRQAAETAADNAAASAEALKQSTEQIAKNAEDVEALKNSLFTENAINLEEYPSYNTIIGSSTGKWGDGTDRATYFVPVSDAVQIDVTANSDASSVIALLKSDAHAEGKTPDYATGGYRMTIPAGETVNLPVPEDCQYIAVMGPTKGVDYSPASVIFHIPASLSLWGREIESEIDANTTAIEQQGAQIEKNSEDVAVLMAAVYVKTPITISEFPGYKIIIGESAGTWGSGSDRITYFIPVRDTLQIDITAKPDTVSVIALLKTDAHASGTKPDYATGGYRMTIPAGETVNLPVPEDCHYIAIMGPTKGVDYSPSSVIFHALFRANAAESTPPIGLHTMPDSEGVLNCIKRCRQMTDIKWTPLFDIPRWSWQTGGYLSNGHCDDLEDVFKAGVEYMGLPYARANKGSSDYGYSNFFTGFNVPFSAFITAIREPNSVMKESVFDLSSKWACMYGVVCSTLACYAYGLSYKATSTLQDVSGMTKIGDLIVDGARMDASLIKLGDMILKTSYHVGVITDIVTDASGNVIAIEVSEATTAGSGNLSRQGTQFGGLCRRKGWPVDEFFSWWKDYSIYRYGNINSVQYTPSPYVNVGDELSMMPQIDYACLPYMGEGFKYKAGSIPNSTIVIGVEGFSYLRVMKDGEYFGEPIAINGETYVDAGFTETGTYSAYLCNMSGDTETKTTGSCHWSVV